MLLVPQWITRYFLEAGNDKLSSLQITCSEQSPPMPRLRALQKKIMPIFTKAD